MNQAVGFPDSPGRTLVASSSDFSLGPHKEPLFMTTQGKNSRSTPIPQSLPLPHSLVLSSVSCTDQHPPAASASVPVSTVPPGCPSHCTSTAQLQLWPLGLALQSVLTCLLQDVPPPPAPDVPLGNTQPLSQQWLVLISQSLSSSRLLSPPFPRTFPGTVPLFPRWLPGACPFWTGSSFTPYTGCLYRV